MERVLVVAGTYEEFNRHLAGKLSSPSDSVNVVSSRVHKIGDVEFIFAWRPEQVRGLHGVSKVEYTGTWRDLPLIADVLANAALVTERIPDENNG